MGLSDYSNFSKKLQVTLKMFCKKMRYSCFYLARLKFILQDFFKICIQFARRMHSFAFLKKNFSFNFAFFDRFSKLSLSLFSEYGYSSSTKQNSIPYIAKIYLSTDKGIHI